MSERVFQVIVPHDRRAGNVAYPRGGFQLYTAQEAVKVMDSFGRKSARRITEGDDLEVWADSEHCRFTLQMWRDDFNGVRTYLTA